MWCRLDLDELGVILADDNNNSLPLDANIPDIYWNAAGAMYAYLFGNLAPAGVEVLGHSQLAGSPPIPHWNIPLAQFPSVSLLDWTTGLGNARSVHRIFGISPASTCMTMCCEPFFQMQRMDEGLCLGYIWEM